jgi:hypothetical protein
MMETPQQKGGQARAAKLSREQRREIALQAAKARWDRIGDTNRLPAASHQGELQIGDVSIEVYRLDDGRRMISKRAMAAALTLKSEGGNAFLRTVSRRGVRSAISEELWSKIENPISFNRLGVDLTGAATTTADGYEAITLIEVCDALMEADRNDELAKSQKFLATQAGIIIRAAAKLGIVALVDEAVGYVDKRKDEYRQLFQEFVANEFRQWQKEFPDKFADMIYRLYGLKRKSANSYRHPGFFGGFTRRFIYHPLANSSGMILEMLDEQNPVVYAGGGRRYKLHQFLSETVGLDAFRQHLWQVIGIGSACNDAKGFEKAFFRAFPHAIPRGHQYGFDFQVEA